MLFTTVIILLGYSAQGYTTEQDVSRNGVYYFINLARRPDRIDKLLQTIFPTSPRLWQHLERIDAVDGRTISLRDRAALETFVTADALQSAIEKKSSGRPTIEHYKGHLLKLNDYLTEGAVACAMSHHLALQAIANHPSAHWGLVLEDDIASAVPQADKAIESLIARLPSDWDVVYLGYHRQGSLAAGDGRNVPFLPLDTDHLAGLYAWIVRKEAAKKILDGVFPVSRQVDAAISTWLFNSGLQVYRVADDSMLFHSLKSEEGLDSDIQTLREVSAEEFDEWNQLWHLFTGKPFPI